MIDAKITFYIVCQEQMREFLFFVYALIKETILF